MTQHKFKFRTYSMDDLAPCAEAFREKFRSHSAYGTRAWTKHVARWFHEAARDDACPCGLPESSEFMLDQCHTTNPCRKHAREMNSAEWDCACKGPMRLLLAMECEWGTSSNAEKSLGQILHDAWKLAVIHANLKVMVYGSHDGDKDRKRIEEKIGMLRTSAADDTPWLLLDVPWHDKDPSLRNIGVKTLP